LLGAAELQICKSYLNDFAAVEADRLPGDTGSVPLFIWETRFFLLGPESLPCR
jgi:hypothetical protein